MMTIDPLLAMHAGFAARPASTALEQGQSTSCGLDIDRFGEFEFSESVIADSTPTISLYDLSGGSTVTVLKPFGAGIYAAICSISGEYPQRGQIAVNSGRTEYLFVISGRLDVRINDRLIAIGPGQAVLVSPGDRYSLAGVGLVSVLIKDEPGGKTEIRQA